MEGPNQEPQGDLPIFIVGPSVFHLTPVVGFDSIGGDPQGPQGGAPDPPGGLFEC